MATIQENRKNGKLVSYKFTACVGRDAAGKQIRYYRTWTPPREYAPAKARKYAQLEAALWEQAIRKHGINSAQMPDSAAARCAEKTDFCAFITDTWLPIQVCNGSKKPKTEDFYKSMTKLICKYFDGWFLQDIRPIDIQKYLIYLRTEYTGKSGKPLTAKTLSHQYSTLHLIFGYAEQQELISKNPMRKVNAPKKEKRPVDALTQAQAQRFFQCLHDCPLDFQCMLHLLITTGIRRGECLGLKWKDIDARAATLNIARNGVDDVIHKRDVLHQNGVDGNADDNQKCLEAQRQQGTDVILPHAAPFLAHHGRHWDGGNRGDEIYFNHSSECDNENADGQRPHGNAHEQRLEPQAE